MKKLLFFYLLALSCIILNAQDEDYTSYVKTNFPKTHATIKSMAAKEWPGDYEMQAYKIMSLCNALHEYITLDAKDFGIPEEVYSDISSTAVVEWSENPDFGTKCDDLSGIQRVDCAYSILRADWEMVVYEIKKQAEAYKSIN